MNAPNNAAALLPCPFCGGPGSVVRDSGNEVWNQSWHVGCAKCGVQMKEWGSNSWASKRAEDEAAETKAVGRWNTRATLAQPDALTSKLDVDALAQEIRRVDGGHSLAVDVLAEALAPYITALTSQPSGGGRTPDELTFGPAAKTLEELRSELEADDVADLINDEAVDTGNFIHDPLYKALDELYRRGWTDLHKGRDYDPRGTDEWGAVLDLFRKHRPNPAADAPAGSGEWVAGSPAVPGIYRVRGWHVGRPTDTAVVEVVDLDGVLWCNLHCDNSERDIEGEWDTVANFNPRFEWQPLTAALAPKPEGGQ